MVESAIVMPLMVFIILGVIQLSMIQHARIMTEYAAYNAARAGIVWNGDPWVMENAAIISFWGASPPLWHAQFVLGERPDVLIVDDTNIAYEGWGTREARIDSVICSRPVFILPVNAGILDPTRERFTVTEALTVRIGSLSPIAAFTLPVYRVEPRPGTCP